MTTTASAQSRRQRVQDQQREAAAIQRRRQQRTLAAAVATVLAVLAGLVIAAGVTDGPAGPATQPATASAKLVAAIASVPTGTLHAVGAGSATNPPRPVNDAPLIADDKPQVLYIGAEYCPFCAAQRWPLIQALSRFGTFSGLSTTRSAAGDVHPNTPTFTFHDASYTSDYLSFAARELYTNERTGSGYTPLETLTPGEATILNRYGGGFPLLDLGGRYVQTGASYSPDVLHGLDWPRITAAIAQPNNDIARGIDGTANALTGYLCRLTGAQPANVCTDPAVVAVSQSTR